MDEKMEIRELKMQDSKDVEGMMLKIFSVEPWNDDWSDREQLRQYVQELMGNRNSLSFGLYEDGGLIGISLGRIKHWCEGTEYWIDEFGILPGKQGAGMGSAFLAGIERCLTERRIFEIVLLTDRDVPAYWFYRKNGFGEIAGNVFFAKKIADRGEKEVFDNTIRRGVT